MSPFELNKIAGAILFAGLVAMISWIIPANVYHVEGAHGSAAYALPVAEEVEEVEQAEEADGVAEADAAEEVVAAVSIDALLAEADSAKGQKIFKKCGACHTQDQGGKNKVGPNLWNIVGRGVAADEGYNYSDAMASRGGSWSIAALNEFLANPKGSMPGTKMSFAGVKKDGDRANVLLFLQSLSE